MVKICCKCQRELECSSKNFYCQSRNKDGFRSNCKECHLRQYFPSRLSKTKKFKDFREYQKNYEKTKYHQNIAFRLTKICRARLNLALNKNFYKSSSTLSLIGCSPTLLKEYLEKQFKIGMTWDNFGKWHIDHIKPCSSFDLSKLEEQAKCFHYTNLQPLWAKENLQKSNK